MSLKTCMMLVLGAIGAVGCGADVPEEFHGSVRDSAGIRIIEISSIEEAGAPRTMSLDRAWDPSESIELGELVDISVTPDGFLFLLDRLAAEVIVISPNLADRRAFGREGDGPGEFSPQGLTSLIVTDTSVLVPDLVRQRITEFDHGGQVLSIRSLPTPAYATDWKRHPVGGVVYRTHSQDGGALVHWHDTSADTLAEFEPTGALPNTLLPPVPLWDLNASGRLVIGRSDSPRIEVREDGEQWITLLPMESREVGVSEREQLQSIVLELVRQTDPSAISTEVLAQIQYPDVMPMLANLRVTTNGEIWVRLGGDVDKMGRDALRVASAVGYGGSSWLILTRDGLLDRRVVFEQEFTPREFSDEWIYGIHMDDMGVSRPARVRRTDS